MNKKILPSYGSSHGGDAPTLTFVEKQFRTAKGFRQIPELMNELKKIKLENKKEVA